MFHTGNWAPLLIDYGSLREHDASALERWTLDGDYIHSNFSDANDIYIVQDTRDLFISGFTFELQIHYSLAPFILYRAGWLRRALKIRLAHQFLFTRGILDPVKKEFFRRPIRLRGGNSSEAAWRSTEARAARGGRSDHRRAALIGRCFRQFSVQLCVQGGEGWQGFVAALNVGGSDLQASAGMTGGAEAAGAVCHVSNDNDEG